MKNSEVCNLNKINTVRTLNKITTIEQQELKL